MKVAPEGRLGKKSPEELRSLIRVLHRHYSSQDRSPAVKAAIEAIESELSHRQRDNQQEGEKILNQQAMEQGKNLHAETIGEMGKLKTSVGLLKDSVDRLAKPRLIDWAILIAGIIAAI